MTKVVNISRTAKQICLKLAINRSAGSNTIHSNSNQGSMHIYPTLCWIFLSHRDCSWPDYSQLTDQCHGSCQQRGPEATSHRSLNCPAWQTLLPEYTINSPTVSISSSLSRTLLRSTTSAVSLCLVALLGNDFSTNMARCSLNRRWNASIAHEVLQTP